MTKYNCILIFNRAQDHILFGREMDESGRIMYRLLGGEVESGMMGTIAAYCQMAKDTGFNGQQVQLTQIMDIPYPEQDFFMEVYVGEMVSEECDNVQKQSVHVAPDGTITEWLSVREDFSNSERFLGADSVAQIVAEVLADMAINPDEVTEEIIDETTESAEITEEAEIRDDCTKQNQMMEETTILSEPCPKKPDTPDTRTRAHSQIHIQPLWYDFSVCKVVDYSQINPEDTFCFPQKTDVENSLVCLTDHVPANTTEREDGWKAFRIKGQMEFSLVGILAGIADVLAEEKIGIFAISTFNTDYVMVKKEDFVNAIDALRKEGYILV